jgi:hypothetical protein
MELEWFSLVHRGGDGARRKSDPRDSDEQQKLEKFSGPNFERRWRRNYCESEGGLNMKVESLCRGFATVQRSCTEVACTGGEMRRKMAPRSRKTGTSFSILSRSRLRFLPSQRGRRCRGGSWSAAAHLGVVGDEEERRGRCRRRRSEGRPG